MKAFANTQVIGTTGYVYGGLAPEGITATMGDGYKGTYTTGMSSSATSAEFNCHSLWYSSLAQSHCALITSMCIWDIPDRFEQHGTGTIISLRKGTVPAGNYSGEEFVLWAGVTFGNSKMQIISSHNPIVLRGRTQYDTSSTGADYIKMARPNNQPGKNIRLTVTFTLVNQLNTRTESYT